MAKIGKRAFWGAANTTMIEQTDAAMRAKINRGVFQIHRPFTTWTNVFGQARERRVVTEFFTALCVRQLLGQPLIFKVHQRHQPQATLKLFFGKTQSFAHEMTSGKFGKIPRDSGTPTTCSGKIIGPLQ